MGTGEFVSVTNQGELVHAEVAVGPWDLTTPTAATAKQSADTTNDQREDSPW